jgi:hypothetical protein
MNEQAKPKEAGQAGGAIMASTTASIMATSNRNSTHVHDNRTAMALGAGILIMMGLSLQWAEMLFAHYVAANTWFFATLFGQAWNMISAWISSSALPQYLQYWPLLLVVTGAAILFSRGPKRATAANESRTGARRDA